MFMDDLTPLQKGSLVFVLLDIALVSLGWILIPSTSPISVAAGFAILIVYGLGSYFAPRLFGRPKPSIAPIVLVFGLLAGSVFAGEMVLEYILLPADNTTFGLVEFGLVFFLYFLAGLITAYRMKSLRPALLAAMGSAMLSALIWLAAMLIVFYVFRGSPQQTQVFRAEGNYADFARSGMRDFNAFIMEDFLGAGFFHLLLGPVIALLLGAFGGLIGKLFVPELPEVVG
jgi:hypothetical protein